MDNDVDEDIEEPITKTVLNQFTYSHSIYDIQNNQTNISPAKEYMPLECFQDKY
jgi:hypothetical protein